MRNTANVGWAVLLVVMMGGCLEQQGGALPDKTARAEIEADVQARIERVLDEALHRYEARADSVREALRPIPLLRASEKAALRRYLNPQHLAQARRLGVSRPQDSTEVASLRRSGELIRLQDSTAYWTIRELNYSVPFVVPDVEAMLKEIGRRFQERLDELGLPPFRLEVSSVLRTIEDQDALRNTNPNASRSASTHEFGTTIDIAYSSYAAPTQSAVEVETKETRWLQPYLDKVRDAMLERAAARKSRELQAILGHVLQEMQDEGKIMVTYERRQPVYHITVAQQY